MTVQELINELQLCNPDLPVICESDCDYSEGWAVKSMIFAGRLSTPLDDVFRFGHGAGERCVVIRQVEADIDDDQS